MFWLHIEIDFESNVSIDKHLFNIFCTKNIKHVHIQDYLVFVEGFHWQNLNISVCHFSGWMIMIYSKKYIAKSLGLCFISVKSLTIL